MRLTRAKRMEETPGASIQAALQEWKDAVAYFESVHDPELVEYAAYGIEAARRKYIFLLRNSGGKGPC